MITTNLTKGTKLVVIDNKSCHNIPLNTKVKYSYSASASEGKIYVSRDGKILGQYFYNSDLRLDIYTIEDMNDELKSAEEAVLNAEKVVENIKFKIEYMTEVGSDNFDENEYKAYSTLKTLENTNLTTLDKAKQIASLFNI